jgi:carbon monoxide dehydrogenase subunit G
MKWLLYGLLGVVGVVMLALLVLLMLGGARGESRLQATIEIARPAPVVFDWITHPSRVQAWVGWLVEIQSLTPGESAVGSREVWVMEDRNNNNQRMEIRSEIIGLEKDRSLTARLHAEGGFEGTVSYALEPLGPDRTRLQYLGDYKFEHWLAKLLEPVISRSAQQKLEEDLARLKQLAEAE